jgi:hypothetical protein
MGIRELRAQASQLGIKGYSRLNKAELEQAVARAMQSNVPENSKPLGEVAGRMIFVGQNDTDQTIGQLLGSFNKSDARKVRHLLSAAGYHRFAAVPRMSEQRPAKAA